MLRLIFTACHPALAVKGRVALTLRLIGGLTTAEIARAFLVPEKTMGQRIFRAKKTLSEAHGPFETPRGDELKRRVMSVLSVVYLTSTRGIPRLMELNASARKPSGRMSRWQTYGRAPTSQTADTPAPDRSRRPA